MATAKTTKAAPKKRKGPQPKNRQQTSAARIVREKLKGQLLAFRQQGFTLRDCLPALDEAFGPESDEPLPGYKRPSLKHAYELCREAIGEIVDPLLKQEMLTLTISQHNQLLAAMMGPALQGSIGHAQLALQILEKINKITKVTETEEPGAGAITQIFINGDLARV